MRDTINRLPTHLAKLFDRVINGLAVLAAGIILFAWLSICTEIVLRYFFSKPQVWVVPLTEISLLFITFLGIAWVLREEKHVRIEIAVDLLPPAAKSLVGAISSVLATIMCLLLFWYSAELTWTHIQRGTIDYFRLELPRSIILGVIPAGSLLLFVQLLRRSRRYLIEWKGARVSGKKSDSLDSLEGGEGTWSGG